MSERSNIQWCDSSKSFWEGCTFKSAGCLNCYAYRNDQRFYGGVHWGKGAPRRKVLGAVKEVRRWHKKPWLCDHCGDPAIVDRGGNKMTGMCQYCGTTSFHRRSVFLNPSSDWLDSEVAPIMLCELLQTIAECPNLDFILCTKRPGNFRRQLENAHVHATPGSPTSLLICNWFGSSYFQHQPKPPANVIVLFSAEDQENYDGRIVDACMIPAVRRGVSIEPMLGPVDLKLDRKPLLNCDKPLSELINWVIVGGESGKGRVCDQCKGQGKVWAPSTYPPRGAEHRFKIDCHSCEGGGIMNAPRPCYLDWIDDVRIQTKNFGIPTFIKQVGSLCVFENGNRWEFPDPQMVNSYPLIKTAAGGRMLTRHQKGGDASEWPETFRVQQSYKPIER